MKIYEYYNKHLKINLQSNDDLPLNIMEKKISKGKILTDYDQVERHVYFLQKGIMQLTILGDGIEKIIDFYGKDTFICSYTSFLIQQPSDVQLIALTDCVVEVFTYDDLQKAYKTSLIVNQMGRKVTEWNYIIKVKREKDFLLKTAEERYAELIAEKPDVVAELPVNKIAKYLGIHPESLSRIRKKVIF
jgi:CRP-like cAMP-binding protein